MRIDPRLRELNRLDLNRTDVTQRIAPSSADPARAAFEALLRARRAAAGSALRKEIDRLGMPTIDDPGIFTPARSLEILHHLVETLLPQLGVEPEILALANNLLQEEIAQHRALEAQLAMEDSL